MPVPLYGRCMGVQVDDLIVDATDTTAYNGIAVYKLWPPQRCWLCLIHRDIAKMYVCIISCQDMAMPAY
jgi:hypothetical protein